MGACVSMLPHCWLPPVAALFILPEGRFYHLLPGPGTSSHNLETESLTRSLAWWKQLPMHCESTFPSIQEVDGHPEQALQCPPSRKVRQREGLSQGSACLHVAGQQGDQGGEKGSSQNPCEKTASTRREVSINSCGANGAPSLWARCQAGGFS